MKNILIYCIFPIKKNRTKVWKKKIISSIDWNNILFSTIFFVDEKILKIAGRDDLSGYEKKDAQEVLTDMILPFKNWKTCVTSYDLTGMITKGKFHL